MISNCENLTNNSLNDNPLNAQPLNEPRLYRQPGQRDDAPASSARLVRHAKRPQWGTALCAWVRADRSAFQFEDGALRTFRNTHVDLLKPVDLPPVERMRLVRALRAASGLNAAKRKLERGDDVELTFDQQLTLFHHLYEDGFAGASWTKRHRGREGRRTLKRHRDAAIALAAKLLAEDELRALLLSQRYETVVERLVEVLASTDLIAKRWLEQLSMAAWADAQVVAEALTELLYGEQSIRHRIEHYANALMRTTGKASWKQVTAPLALRWPAQHAFVNPTTYRAQAKNAGDGSKLKNRVDGSSYLRMLDMLQIVSDRLAAAGRQPRDLLDVYDFMWTTMRPSARNKLEEIVAGPVSTTRLKTTSSPATETAEAA